MVCTIEFCEKPKLNNPVLIEGLPGIGFVANISVLHLIHKLEAKLFARIFSSTFQDITVTTKAGGMRSPINELYYYKSNDDRDLILWFGNVQALTTHGQYELCGRVLDISSQLGCKYIITLGGCMQKEIKGSPKIYCAASDPETFKSALKLGAKKRVGQIFGVTGLIIGLGSLRGFSGFSLLVETAGTHPDASGANYLLSPLCRHLNLKVDLSDLEASAEKTRKMLESFGLLRNIKEEKKEKSRFRWFV